MPRLVSGLQRLTAGAVAIALGACSPEPIQPPGAVGAGLRLVITTVALDSIGYSVLARAVNADIATLEYGACAGSVEVQRNGDWINLTPGGQCILIGYGVSPGEERTFTQRHVPVNRGEQIRFVVGWSPRSGAHDPMASRSAPFTVD